MTYQKGQASKTEALEKEQAVKVDALERHVIALNLKIGELEKEQGNIAEKIAGILVVLEQAD